MMANPARPGEWTLGRALRTRALWLFFAASFLLWGIGTTLIITHQVAFTRDIGFSPDFGAVVYLAFGIAYFISNLGGFISDSIGREKTMTVGVVGAMAGVLMLVLANWYPDARLLFLYSALFGLGAGLCAPVLTAALADFFQGKHFGAINGFVTMSFGVGGAISPWLGGYIHDQLHTYIPAFAIVMVAIAASCVCVWLAEPKKAVEAARRSRLVRATARYADPPGER
jgi:MFS family permease